ncbi:MAG: hypothetical protein AD742_20890 [Methylibium sp. NZG]|nr:MAG: hypothetical protein AD742_20890 [Methylibium sp. NZG]
MTLINRGMQISGMRLQYADPDGSKAIAETSGWFASSTNAIETVFPNASHAYRTTLARALNESNTGVRVAKIAEIMKAMLIDIDAGVVASVADVARGEVFDDFLDHADHYLKAGKVGPAGVVAGVAFEDTIRRACEKNAILQKDVELEQLISALVKADLMNSVKATRARAAAALRTKATHAQWGEFSKNDVEATIATTRDLVGRLLAS